MSQDKERFINIRKLAALDIVRHEKRLILAEFALSVLIGAAVGLFSLSNFLRSPDHPFFPAILGIIALGISFNYLPLLIYAIDVVRHKSAQQEVVFEFENGDRRVRKYTSQSLMLAIPFAVFVLAVTQEFQKRKIL